MQTQSVTAPYTVSERRFYTGMAIAIFLVVFVGFSRSFFLRPLFPEHPSPSEPIFYIHGALFTLWILLFALQVTLIKRGSVQLHRNIGLMGMLLAIAMVILGTMGALYAAARPTGFVGIPVPGLSFLAIPFFDMILFSTFVTMAYLQRRNTQSHKRWMVLATLNLITAAIARWPLINSLGPLAYFAMTDLFVVVLAIWDLKSRKKIHRVTLSGGLLLILSHPVRLVVSGTAVWLAFAAWATGFVK
jgi:hypothetical protein